MAGGSATPPEGFYDYTGVTSTEPLVFAGGDYAPLGDYQA